MEAACAASACPNIGLVLVAAIIAGSVEDEPAPAVEGDKGAAMLLPRGRSDLARTMASMTAVFERLVGLPATPSYTHSAPNIAVTMHDDGGFFGGLIKGIGSAQASAKKSATASSLPRSWPRQRASR